VAIGLLTGLRFIYYYLGGNGDGHIQSLILASVRIFPGTRMWMGTISEN
jgi:hypothetical protein